MILIVQNDPLVPLAAFDALLKEAGASFCCWQAYRENSIPTLDDFQGLIILGGTMGVHDEEQFPFLRQVKGLIGEALQRRIPLLGICLGGQMLAAVAGGSVTSRTRGERGLLPVSLTPEALNDQLFRGLPATPEFFQWHDDSFTPPGHAEHLAESGCCPHQAFRIGRAWGVQFHPEVDRETVSLWSRGEVDAAELVDAFTQGEPASLQQALILLGNFLRIIQGGVSD
jgi:GMP synthase-like glutamine amidotransferase